MPAAYGLCRSRRAIWLHWPAMAIPWWWRPATRPVTPYHHSITSPLIKTLPLSACCQSQVMMLSTWPRRERVSVSPAFPAIWRPIPSSPSPWTVKPIQRQPKLTAPGRCWYRQRMPKRWVMANPPSPSAPLMPPVTRLASAMILRWLSTKYRRRRLIRHLATAYWIVQKLQVHQRSPVVQAYSAPDRRSWWISAASTTAPPLMPTATGRWMRLPRC